MAACGSLPMNVLLDDVFVAEDTALVDNRPSPPHEAWLPDGPVALGVPTRARAWMAGIMLGVAQAALDETIEFDKARSRTLGGARWSSMPGNQFAVADAAVTIENDVQPSTEATPTPGNS